MEATYERISGSSHETWIVKTVARLAYSKTLEHFHEGARDYFWKLLRPPLPAPIEEEIMARFRRTGRFE